MTTVFSRSRFADSQRAHLAAQEQVYPLLFPGRDLSFQDVTKTVRDMGYAVDCEIRVKVPGLRGPLWFTIQERWRFDIQWMPQADVTVTEWNTDTDLPSELHKFGAHLFVYGFYDRNAGEILRFAVVDVARMLHALATGELTYSRRPRTDQTFLAFTLDDLASARALILRLDEMPSRLFLSTHLGDGTA